MTLTAMTTYTQFNLVNLDNQIVVWGSSSILTSPSNYVITQTINVLLDQSGTPKLIFNKTFSAINNPTKIVFVGISPSFSKIHYNYLADSSTDASTFMYEIDYSLFTYS